MHLSFTHYSSLPPKSIKQFSGMTIFSLGAMVSRVIEKGMDESPIQDGGFGLDIKGKVMPPYPSSQPIDLPPPQEAHSLSQQNTYLNSVGDNRCPQTTFLQDLCSDIHKFIEQGDHIVLLLDSNSNMKSSDLLTALTTLSLQEAILSWHGFQGPLTFRTSMFRRTIPRRLQMVYGQLLQCCDQ